MKNLFNYCRKIALSTLAVFFGVVSLVSAAAADKLPSGSEDGIYMLCYHNISRYISVRKTPNVISPQRLEEHILELRRQGYEFLSMEQYLAVCRGEMAKPPKAVVITFDDGYESFYKTAYPILKKHNVPAMMAIIGSWMDGGASEGIKMSTWEQFREMESSGLVTIASHTYDLHKPVYINGRGDMAPAIGSRLYRAGIYEGEAAYRSRLSYDFNKAQAHLAANLGHESEYLVWPYGDYNELAIELAKQAGFKYMFQLGGGWNIPAGNLTADDNMVRIRRIMVDDNVAAENMIGFMKSYTPKTREDFRVVRADVKDYYVPESQTMTDANIDLLVEQLHMIGVRYVILNMADDADGNGQAETVYFHNEQGVPVKADIASHFVGRLNAEGFRVCAWMPALSDNWENVFSTGAADKTADIKGLFHDLALYVPIGGLYFDEAGLEKAQTTACTDELIADLQTVRMQFPIYIAAVPMQTVFAEAEAERLLQHYDFLLVKVQPSKADIAQLESELGAAKPYNSKLRDNVIISFAEQTDGVWNKAGAIRQYSNLLQENGFRLFGFNGAAMMEDSRWYLPNIYTSEAGIWKKFGKAAKAEGRSAND